jgi:DNA-binding transcriptional LysR family regulator
MHWSDRVGRRLKPRDLHVFLAVAEHGNMAKAADRLAISRPVVSKTIADLERTLGVRLLDRSPQGIEPTLFGRALIRRSAAVFDELRQSVKEIEFLADPTAGELCIGCGEALAAGFVPAVIDRLSRSYPRVLFQVELGTPATLQLRELRERKVELVVTRMLGAAPEPDMNVQILFHEQMFVVAGKRNKWNGRHKLELRDLVDEPWILAPLELMPESPFAEAFGAAGLTMPRAKVLCHSPPLRNTLLATGRYLTLVPGSMLRFSAERSLVKVLPVKLPRWRLPVAIITLKNRTLSPVAQLFVDCASELAKLLEKGMTA